MPRAASAPDVRCPVDRYVRFGISTALLCVALVLLPRRSGVVPLGLPLATDAGPGWVHHHVVEILVFDVCPQALFVGLVTNLGFLLHLAWHHRWRRMVQPLVKLLVCVSALLFIPVY